LQRIYAISFPEKVQLKEFIEKREEALKRDHRELGLKQGLFFWNSKFAPGSAFFLPHGAVIYDKLVSLMKLEYKRRNFKEVVTPNIFNVDLWKVSGHYKNYKDDLFLLPSNDGGQWQGLKPMNCPGHCLIFANQTHSYRELPLKIADFGVLHRNELTGALSGLTRVRRFQQDDAHIFCRQD
jgi:threonyl-tRNA synthetase